MYQRCPRQYAYRYVYKLQPREIGLATFMHLQAALYKLQKRLQSGCGVKPHILDFQRL